MTLANHSDENQHIAKGALINFFGFFARFSRGLLLILIARLYGSDTLGTYTISFAIMEIFSRVIGLGFDWGLVDSYVKSKIITNHAQLKSFTLFLIKRFSLISILLVFVAICVLNSVAKNYFRDTKVLYSTCIFLFALPFSCSTRIITSAFRIKKEIKYEVYISSIIEPLCLLLFGVMSYLFNRNIYFLVSTQIFANMIGFLSAYFFFNKIFPVSLDFNIHSFSWKSFFAHSIPSSFSEFINLVKQKLDLLVIGKLLPLNEVGIYSGVLELSLIIKKMSQVFEPISIPILGSYLAQNKILHLESQFKSIFKWVFTLASIVFASMILAPDFFLSFYGSNFKNYENIFIILSFGMFISTIFNINEIMLVIGGRSYLNLFISLIYILVGTILSVFLTKEYGLFGVSLATTLSAILFATIKYALTKSIFKYSHSTLQIFKLFLSLILSCLIAFLIKNVFAFKHSIGAVFIFLLVYIPIYKKLFYSSDDQSIITSLRNKFNF